MNQRNIDAAVTMRIKRGPAPRGAPTFPPTIPPPFLAVHCWLVDLLLTHIVILVLQ